MKGLQGMPKGTVPFRKRLEKMLVQRLIILAELVCAHNVIYSALQLASLSAVAMWW